MADEVKFSMSLPQHMSDALKKEAAEIGISREALMKMILHRHIKENEK